MSFKYTFVVILSVFLINSCTKPEAVTEKFVKALANGKCEEALELANSQAKNAVQGALEAGCESYKSEIIGQVTCDVDGDVAICSCTEKRDLPGAEYLTFTYKLEKKGTDWKVSSYTKDNPLIESIEE